MENVTDIVFFIVSKILFSFYWSVGFEENIRRAKKGITSATEWADILAVTNEIVLTLQVFFSPEATVINLFAIFQVFLVGLGN